MHTSLPSLVIGSALGCLAGLGLLVATGVSPLWAAAALLAVLSGVMVGALFGRVTEPETPPEEEDPLDDLHPIPLEPPESIVDDDPVSAAVWRAALQACTDGMIITGPDDRVLFANGAVCKIFECDTGRLSGMLVEELFPSLDDEESSTAGYRRTGQDVLGVEWQTHATRMTGESFPVELTISALDERGMGLYQLRDITDRRVDMEKAAKVNAVLEELRDQALTASRAKSSFLANMSHELRTPLNAILGYSELVGEEVEDPEIREDVLKIKLAGRHLLTLINSVLDLSKIEAGRMELYMETVSVEMVVSDVVEIATPLAIEKSNRFTVVVEPDVGRMVADQVKLRQVLVNLLGNAFKFTESGEVTLSVARFSQVHADWIRFEVRDTGVGIESGQQDTLFEQFDQGDVSTTRKFGGTGLGLAISRRFCRMMGGDIQVESAPERGSIFTVKLPANTSEHAPEEEALGGEGVRVLVIDDDPGVRELLARTLAREGHSVLTASTGQQGLDRAATFDPDVITLDVRMPGMDGWTVLAALKSDPALAHVPVVMLSMLDEHRTGFALGASAYLTKPIDRAQLLGVVAAFRNETQPFEVLLVEDQPEVRELVRRTLEADGWVVREAATGVEALDALEASVPSVMLLDLMMPEMDGFELLERLEKNPLFAALPVIVITAMDLSTDQRERLQSRVDRILEKGVYGREDLLRLVRDKVSDHALRRARMAVSGRSE